MTSTLADRPSRPTSRRPRNRAAVASDGMRISVMPCRPAPGIAEERRQDPVVAEVLSVLAAFGLRD